MLVAHQHGKFGGPSLYTRGAVQGRLALPAGVRVAVGRGEGGGKGRKEGWVGLVPYGHERT